LQVGLQSEGFMIIINLQKNSMIQKTTPRQKKLESYRCRLSTTKMLIDEFATAAVVSYLIPSDENIKFAFNLRERNFLKTLRK
jgi:hypothetical protein